MTSNHREELLDRIRGLLVCQECRGPLGGTSALTCSSCSTTSRTVRRGDGRYDFGGLTMEVEKTDWLNAVKGAAKRKLGRLYPLAIDVLAPVYGDSGSDVFLRSFGPDAVVCNLGSGAKSYDDQVVCVDGYPYEPVHVVCDLSRLPFADGSIDGVISEAVLEHVPDPAAHVAEIRRVLRPGGRVLCFFPFMQAFHASPHDYSRLTLPGLRHLFDGFHVEKAKVAGGPTSGLLWTLQEWLAMVGSFGSERLYRLLVPVTWVLSPLKYLDVVLIHHPAAQVIASGFVVEATKPMVPPLP